MPARKQRKKKKDGTAAPSSAGRTAPPGTGGGGGGTSALPTTTTVSAKVKATGPVSVDPTLPDQVARMPHPALVARGEQIRSRLAVIAVDGQRSGARVKARAGKPPPPGGQDCPPPVVVVPYEPRTDVHWDYVVKEMMWLAADFQSERKAQTSAGRKLAGAVRQFHRSRETRQIREMAEAELKRRRLANRLARDVCRGWWAKVERVVAHKQKVTADAGRRRAMDRHLVHLVRQTERYGRSLADRHALERGGAAGDGANGGGGATRSANGSGGPALPSGAEEEHRTQSIEQALAAASRTGAHRRRSKAAVTNYRRVAVDPSDSELYGTSTADDSDDYTAASDGELADDVSTLVEAERMGTREDERDEARKLREESEMDIEQVLERLREEAAAAAVLASEEEDGQEEKKGDDERETSAPRGRTSRRSRKVVQFAPTAATAPAPAATRSGENIALRPRRAYSPSGHGSDADDDADASDVEDFDASVGDISDGSDEFEADAGAVDDERTMAAEERLGRDMPYQQEIDLLSQEAEMSVEQLRAMYMPQAAAAAAVQAAEEDEKMPDEDAGGDSSGSEEFVGNDRDGIDDETTLEAEERLGREMSAEDEINMLNREAEMSVEELRAMYAGIDEGGSPEDGGTKDGGTKLTASAADSGKRRSRSRRSATKTEEIESNSTSRRSRRRVAASMEEPLGEEGGDDPEGEEEFQLQGAGEVDDETTLEAEERLGRDMSYQQEIDLLKRESEMSVEELRAMYAGVNGEDTGDLGSEGDDSLPPEPTPVASLSAGRRRTRPRAASGTRSSKLANDAFKDDDGAEEDEYRPEARAAVDNEDTLAAEERLGREMSPEEELEMLQHQNEIPIEELRAMYTAMENEGGNQSDDADEMSCDDADSAPSNGERSKRKREEEEEETMDVDEFKQGVVEENKKVKTSNNKSNEEEEDATVDVLKALEESEAKARQTVVSRPFLLAPWVKLREYQQIGLNWLVSTQGRRLNGILADEMGKCLHDFSANLL